MSIVVYRSRDDTDREVYDTRNRPLFFLSKLHPSPNGVYGSYTYRVSPVNVILDDLSLRVGDREPRML